MRKLIILSVAALLVNVAAPSMAEKHEIVVDEQLMRTLGEFLNQPGDPPIKRIEVFRDDGAGGLRAPQAFVENPETTVINDGHCLRRYDDEDTYIVKDAIFKFVWCQESDYDPEVPAKKRVQRDTYFFGLPWERFDNIQCTVDNTPLGWPPAATLPQEAYDMLCIDSVIPPK